MQTSYTQDPVDGLPGQLSSGYPHAISTRVAEGKVQVGLYVIGGSKEKTAKHPTADFTATPEKALGIVHRDPANVLPMGAEENVYEDKQDLGVVRRGKVWVAPDIANPHEEPGFDAPVYVRITAGTGKPAGMLRAAAAELTSELTITVSGTGDGDVFELEANGEDLSWESGSSEDATQKATAWAAHINGLDGWTASSSGAVITVEHDSGYIEIDDAGDGFTAAVAPASGSTVAVLLPGAFFRRKGNGGVYEVELGAFDD